MRKPAALSAATRNAVVAIEVTERNTQDAPYFVPLVSETMQNFDVTRILGDKAYSSYANLELAVQNGATPFIPFKNYAVGTSKSETWNRMFHFFSFNRAEFLKAYHQRSNVEATFSAIKRKFGDYVRSRTRTAPCRRAGARPGAPSAARARKAA